MELVTSFLYQVVFTVGVIVLFGLFIALCRRGFCRLVGRAGPTILLITGAVGTPIHELSHALMCVIFGHKIDKIKLYQPNSKDGTLGYVSHSFNRKNLYHRIGTFFIGVAPIIGGSGAILLLMALMLPDMSTSVWQNIGQVEGLYFQEFNLAAVCEFLIMAWKVFLCVFDLSYVGSAVWWIFIILALMISSHMELSPADIKNGVGGFLLLLLLMLAVDAVIFFVYRPALATVTLALVSFGLALASFLLISWIFGLVMVFIALIIKGIRSIFTRK